MSITDEWGEAAEVGEEATAAPDADPPIEEDEWGKDSEAYSGGNGSAGGGSESSDAAGVDKNVDLKRCLVDSFYGTELGLRASAETRAEVVELINQLEAANPTAAPTESAAVLDGNWILLYVVFSSSLNQSQFCSFWLCFKFKILLCFNLLWELVLSEILIHVFMIDEVCGENVELDVVDNELKLVM